MRDVRVLQGVSNWLDSYAAAVTRGYKFYPALSDNGEPTSGHFLWKFVIQDNPDDHGVEAPPADDPVGGRPSTHIRR